MVIDGIAGPVAVTVNPFTGRHTVTVGGHPAAATGRRTVALPTTDGRTVTATVHSGLVDPYPTIEIAGVRYRTGPSLPVGLRVLALLPLVLLIGGLIGGAIGGLGVVINLAIARRSRSTALTSLLMIMVFAIAVITFMFVVAAIAA
jgi:hypothetical protein